jgi:Flavodoxins
MKSIILYYSRSGNTEKLASKVKQDLECDILKIEPEKVYGNYIASCIRVIGENIRKEKPKFITEIPNLDIYDVILVGYPIWVSDMPVFVSEFISQCDLNNKKVIPFATFGKNNISGSIKTLQRACIDAEIMLPFNYGIFKKDDYESWIKSIQKIIK